MIIYWFLLCFLFESCKSKTNIRSVHNNQQTHDQLDNEINKINTSLIHLYSDMKEIQNNTKRIDSFWRAGGWACQKIFDQGETVYFNTHGHGVNYLHLRVETKARYYLGEATNIKDQTDALDFYNHHFKNKGTKKNINDISYEIDRTHSFYEVVRFFSDLDLTIRHLPISIWGLDTYLSLSQ